MLCFESREAGITTLIKRKKGIRCSLSECKNQRRNSLHLLELCYICKRFMWSDHYVGKRSLNC
jgi:hypothetical protein